MLHTSILPRSNGFWLLTPYHTGHLIAEFTLVKEIVIHGLPSQPPVHFRVQSPIVLAANTPSRCKQTGRYRHPPANSRLNLVKVARHPFRLVTPSAVKFKYFADMNAPPSAT